MYRSRNVDRRQQATSSIRRDRVLRSAVLGLVTYALGLIPFYFLTPVHQAVRTVFFQSASAAVVGGLPPVGTVTPTPSPSVAKRQKKAGADTVSVVDSTPQAKDTPVPVPTEKVTDPRYAFLLLGYGGGGHDGAYLTDSMMLVIVDPAKKSLTLLSLPRDSWVPMYFNGQTAVYNKINTAYAFAKDPSLYPDRLNRYTGSHGPGNFAMDTVSRLLGVSVRYYLGLDFQGFRDMINAVGGIDVNVPDGFASRYPANDDPAINASWITVRFWPGMQHMNGERAIEYARSREVINNPSEASDFARARRQRLIIEAFKKRLFEPGGMIHIPQLLAIASSHVDTNYAIPAVAQLSQLALDWKDVAFYQTALTTGNYLEDGTGPDGTYLLVPSSPDHSWAQISAFTRRLWKDPKLGVAMAGTTIIVENDTGTPGVAGDLSNELIRLGYLVGPPTIGSQRTTSRVLDQTGGKADVVVSALDHDLGLTLPVKSASASSSDNTLVVQLGSDDVDLVSQLQIPVDQSAPISTAGVSKFGVWSPDIATPVPSVRAVPSRRVKPNSRTPEATDTARPVPPESTIAPASSPVPGRTGTPSPASTAKVGALPSASPIPSKTSVSTVVPTRGSAQITPAPRAPSPTVSPTPRPAGQTAASPAPTSPVSSPPPSPVHH